MIDYLIEAQRHVRVTPTKESLAEAVGMTVSGGSFDTYLSRLRANKVIFISNTGHVHPGEVMKWEPGP